MYYKFRVWSNFNFQELKFKYLNIVFFLKLESIIYCFWTIQKILIFQL